MPICRDVAAGAGTVAPTDVAPPVKLAAVQVVRGGEDRVQGLQ